MRVNSKKRAFLFLALFLMMVSLPVVIWLSKQQQEGRIRASAPDQLEAEGGVLSSNVSLKQDSLASGNKFVLFQSPTTSPNPSRWIGPNLIPHNPNDNRSFEGWDSLFADESLWANTLKRVDVFDFFMLAVFKNEGNFVERMVPLMKKYGVAIGIEGGALGQGGRDANGNCLPNDGEIVAKSELMSTQKIYVNGGKIDYYTMDGPIIRTIAGTPNSACHWTLDQSVDDLILFMKTFHAVHPETKFGLIVNFPNWPYKGTPSYRGSVFTLPDYAVVLGKIMDKLNASGEKIYFVHVDNPYDYATAQVPVTTGSGIDPTKIDWVKRILDLQKQIESYGLDFGLIYNSERGGNASDQAFYQDTISYIKLYKDRGGNPQDTMIESWYKYPRNIAPETLDFSFLKLVNNVFPAR